MVFWEPIVIRRALEAFCLSSPIARSTWEPVVFPVVQAEPPDTHTPSISRRTGREESMCIGKLTFILPGSLL